MGTLNKSNKNWRDATKLVRGGTRRSDFAETNEAIFLTSGFVYESAKQAQRAFKGEEDRFIYSRFTNPTVGMFEERMALLENAKACWATSTGMAAVNAALIASLKSGDRLVASAPATKFMGLVPLSNGPRICQEPAIFLWQVKANIANIGKLAASLERR